MADIIVTTTNDVVDAGDGVTSLREALVLANSTAAADVITFDASLAGGTIVLAGSELAITEDVTIDGDVDGDNKADITISGNNASRIFNITGAGTDVYALSLDIADGHSGVNGGAIAAGIGTFLGIEDTTVRDSYSVLNGGGIDAFGGLVMLESTVSNNSTNSYGGGIYVRAGASGTFINTTIDGNTANLNGGGISTGNAASLYIQSSTITDNTAVGAGGGVDLFGGSTATIENSIIGLNSGTNINNHDVNESGAASTVTAQNSFFSSIVGIDVDNGGNFNNLGDPSLGALADNGGTVQTRNITTSSPLINAGDNSLIPGLDEDANGNQRINAGTVDIGATEFFLKVTTEVDEAVDGGLALDAADGGGLSLREAIAHANAGELISFDDSLAGQTIVLSGTELALGQSVIIDGDIDGDNRADITIDANGVSRIFNISNDGTAVTLKSLNLTNGNSATYGGAIFQDDDSSLTVVNSTLSGNQASIFGGAVAFFAGGNLNFFNSLLTDNHTVGAGSGGAIYGSTSGPIYLSNTTVFDNSAGGFGGGIALFKSGLTLANSTIAGNHANTIDADATQGGGVSNTLGAVTLFNSVVANNTSGTAYAGDDVSGPVSSATNSFLGTLEGIGPGGGGNIDGGGNPLLGELLDNGGTTLTLSPLDGSALIDSGNNAAIPFDTQDLDEDGVLFETLPIDGRGGLRIVGGTVDIGAVEQIVDETIGGTAGDDNIVGGLGNDTATYKDASAGVTQYLLFTGLDTGGAGIDTLSGIENLTGSAFDDRLVGDGGDNILTGGDGIDILKGKGGNDTFFGGDGDDKLTGGAGNDTMFGGAGADRLVALDGLDELNGGDGDDFLFGGKDNDILNGDAGADNIRGNRGVDVINGGGGSDTLRGGGQNDTINGDAGNDFLFGENHEDTLYGGAGDDSLTGGVGGGAFDGFTDIFVYKDTADGGGGFDRIKDFEDGIDVMDLQSFAFADFAAVQALASNSGAGLRIDFGGGDVLFVEDFQLADFDSGDVLI